MKKILLYLICFLSFSTIKAQMIDHASALNIVSNQKSKIGLTDGSIKDAIVSNAYTSKDNIQYIYLQQAYKGLPVQNRILTLAFKNNLLVSQSGAFVKGIENKLNGKSPIASISATAAVSTVMAEKKVYTTKPFIPISVENNKVDFGKMDIANNNITAELLWVASDDNQTVKLAWQISLSPNSSADSWLTRVDANTNQIISENNLTVFCDWDLPSDRKNNSSFKNNLVSVKNNTNNSDISPLNNQTNNTALSPSIVNNASYKVIPFPAESPIHPGGTPVLKNNPWTLAPGNATSLKWHNDGTADYNYSRGNNVWAYHDRANNGTPGVANAVTSTTASDPLSFDFTPNFNISPVQSTPVQNQQFNITNLFYWNNVIHDLVYQYGFDEIGGNFQANNQGRGGLGNDYVRAEAQDGGGTSNANFSITADGIAPRMQMYLWDGTTSFTVNTPASIAGSYTSLESVFSTANQLINVGPVTGQVIYFNDDVAGTTHEGCVAAANVLTGKIALINRGTCAFTQKVLSAQSAGAIAVIMVNNVAGAPIVMGGTDNTITIPAVMISQADGAILVAQLANNVNVTLAALPIDGDVDNGIVVHEFSHGISSRLTGGPSQPACLSNAEQMGEGWSDYYALMATQDWANSNINSGFSNPRAMGTYATLQPITGPGIRTKKYTTDFTINNLVYGTTIPAEVHDLGEIWCATLWDMTWNIIQQTNNINSNIFNPANGGGNTIALKLVTEGMKLQPCNPGFIDGRNAILQADQILYNGQYSCAIKEAFRRRGMGPNASQGLSTSVADQTPDFSPYITLKLTQSASQVLEGQNLTYTNTISACSPVTNYLLTDTLPANVTYVSGGTYTAATRVISFNVNMAAAGTQSFTYTVLVNNGSYFAPITNLDEQVVAATFPTSLTPTSNTATVWTVSTAQSHTAPNALFSPNSAVPSDQYLTTTNPITIGANQSALSFWHQYSLESGYDGGVVEISTDNGTTWNDLGNKITQQYYNGKIDAASGTSLAGREAFTGTLSTFQKTSVNLSSYAGQNVKFRWSQISDNGTALVGWYVDDILVKNEAVVNMRSTLFNTLGVRMVISDTVTLIQTSASCTNISITQQPANSTVCSGSTASFSVTAAGTLPSYQWQISTDAGVTYTNIVGATAATLNVASVTAGMNNYRYRVIVSNTCPSSVTSTGAILTVTSPAGIGTQPVNTTACAGSGANFSVVTTGTVTGYQWQVSTDNGVTFSNISGATLATLNLTAVSTAMNNNQYRVVLSSCAAAINSSAAILTVNSLPTITTQPANSSNCVGSNATYCVTASGTGLTYQWQLSITGCSGTWANITGATANCYTVNAVTSAMNNYGYRCIVSGSCVPAITSNCASLNVTSVTTISSQPVSNTVCQGGNTSFTVVSTGSSNTYQWQVSSNGGTSFTDISAATSATLSLTNVTTAMNNNQYRVVVFSCGPSGLNSTAATLTVTAQATITTQPTNAAACEGSNVSFSSLATGNAVTYQWQRSTDGGTTWAHITGATTNNLNLTAITATMNGYKYRVVINDNCTINLNSNAATLAITAPVGIVLQPANAQGCIGGTASLTVTANSTLATYQWQLSTNNGTSWTNITGATNSILNLSSLTAGMNGYQYKAVVSGPPCGSVNSNAATLSVGTSVGTVLLTATPYSQLYPGLATVLTTTVNPAGSYSYQWYRNNILVPGITTSTYTVNVDQFGTYKVVASSTSGCSSASNNIVLGDSASNRLFIYPNPTSGKFQVRYYNAGSIAKDRTLSIYDSKGTRVYSKEYIISSTYDRMDVNLINAQSGIYHVELWDSKGNRIASGSLLID